MKLSGSERENLIEAMLGAYPDYDSLELMVDVKLDKSLARICKPANQEIVVFKLIKWAESHGKLESLIVGAYEKNLNNPALKNFYTTVFQSFKQRAILDSTVIVAQEFGPNISWEGETDDLELQSFFKKQPDWYDVGFLQRIVEQAKSVCRVDLSAFDVTATGVLIAPKYILTNYHVLKINDDDLEVNAKKVNLNFGCLSLNDGQETLSKTFRLDSQQPILASSPIEKLDYVLLQVEEGLTQVLNQEYTPIKPANLDFHVTLSKSDGLNILQHPNGESMKLSITCDGITGVYPNSGIVQYINRTAGGSSGAPCFNENGELVALHHAQRSKSFGTIREGILLSSILHDLAQKSVQIN
ncbi:MAG: effector-associated domain EAD1-containing protein [Crocosphaera sp.]